MKIFLQVLKLIRNETSYFTMEYAMIATANAAAPPIFPQTENLSLMGV